MVLPFAEMMRNRRIVVSIRLSNCSGGTVSDRSRERTDVSKHDVSDASIVW